MMDTTTVEIDLYVKGEENNINKFVSVFSSIGAKKIGNRKAVIRFNGVRLFNEYTIKLMKYITELNLKYDTRISFLVSEDNLNSVEFFFGVDGKSISIRDKDKNYKIVQFKKCIKIEKRKNGKIFVYIISADLEKGFIKKVIAEVINGKVMKYLTDKEKIIEQCLRVVSDKL